MGSCVESRGVNAVLSNRAAGGLASVFMQQFSLSMQHPDDDMAKVLNPSSIGLYPVHRHKLPNIVENIFYYQWPIKQQTK